MTNVLTNPASEKRSLSDFQFEEVTHQALRRQVYPHLFPRIFHWVTDDMVIRWRYNKEADLDLGVDRIAVVPSVNPAFAAGISFAISERARRPDAMKYADVTFRRWWPRANKPSEVHKTCADYNVYAVYDEHRNTVLKAVVTNMLTVRHALADGSLPWSPGSNRAPGDSTFIAVRERDLAKVGAVVYRYDPTDLAMPLW
jgi:hypothetical protein